jgi:hypothetical protein
MDGLRNEVYQKRIGVKVLASFWQTSWALIALNPVPAAMLSGQYKEAARSQQGC